MAITINTLLPKGRNPDHGESRSVLVEGDGTEQIVNGSGSLDSVTVSVAGTLMTFYDAIAADSLNDSNTLLEVPTADITEPKKFVGPKIAFSRGLRVTTTGGSGRITVGFRGGATIAPRYYP